MVDVNPTLIIENSDGEDKVVPPNPSINLSDGDRRMFMSLNNRTQKENEPSTNATASKCLLFTIKTVIGFMFFLIVLGSAVLSKLTLVSLTDKLRSVTDYPNFTIVSKEDETKVVTIYWYLQFILLIPNVITLVRCLAFGVIGKTTKTFPWPKGRSIILGIVGSVFEVFSMTIFLYLILPELPPGLGILLLCGVFTFQIGVDIIKKCRLNTCCDRYKICSCCAKYWRNGYERVPSQDVRSRKRKTIKHYLLHFFQLLLENRFTKVVALLLQVVTTLVFIIMWVIHTKELSDTMLRPMIGYPLVVFALSVIWSNLFQDNIVAFHNNKSIKEGATAKFKSSFINSSVRLLLYPFVSYVIFRYAFPVSVDPWCLQSRCHITLRSSELSTMTVQVVVTFVGYIIGWVACTMNLSKLSMALPLLLSTPVTVTWYYVSVYRFKLENKIYPYFTVEEEKPFGDVDKRVPIVLSLLWVGELLAMGYFLLVKTNIILSKDSEMFLTPHYDGVFFEQHMILNRQTRKKEFYDKIDSDFERNTGEATVKNPRTVFICSTMYRENETEMKQMLLSIYSMAQHYRKKKETAGNSLYDSYESHIFFDGAINGTQIHKYGLQLLSLLEETLHIDLKKCQRIKTPYGYRLKWDIYGLGGMPFTVHFKDKLLVKPKKRWSQVMYMNYVINYRIKEENLNASDTYILTTDADIDFTPLSADVLLDMLASNQRVGAVCARTHPKGSGPIYWYQIFDYAIGHWFQKPAEHILGCVLCSPGCFSVFRCKALNDVLKEYSSEAIGANEFLMKDMGEDRWLCTLLIEAEWRLEYCAISEDQTYCPTDFGEFFKQRRRWIPSTVANLAQLISKAGSITKKNDSISILFILFQAIMVFSTAISPATIILVIASGLQSAFKLSPSVTLLIISLLIVVSVFYGLVCIYGSPQTQIDVAKILTFVFAVIMSIVIVGVLKDTVYNIVGHNTASVLNFPNCANLTETTINASSFSSLSSTSDISYEECLRIRKYVKGIRGSLWQQPVAIPVSTTTIYLGAFAVTFFIATLLHLPEWYCLIHCVWYLLALPSGYLLLLIYSAANLNCQSWGTREGSTGEDKGILGWFDHIKRWWRLLLAGCLWCCRRKGPWTLEEVMEQQKHEAKEPQKEDEEKKMLDEEEENRPHENDNIITDHGETSSSHCSTPSLDLLDTVECNVQHQSMDEECTEWLQSLDCDDYIEKFENNGYVNKQFIAAMELQDFDAIGIDKRGFKLRLLEAAKVLPSLQIPTDTPTDVAQWLDQLEIPEYIEMFHQQGYKTGKDIKGLIDLKEEDFKAMGISRRAHLQRLRVGIDHLINPIPTPSKMDGNCKQWLRDLNCEDYIDNFEKNGYVNMHFIAAMEPKDFEAIGVNSKGLRLRLQQAAIKLPSLQIHTNVPTDVAEWLSQLEIPEYKVLFQRKGYETGEDIENLKDVTEENLRAMGITRRAHLQRLKVGIENLIKPSPLELRIREVETTIDNVSITDLSKIKKKEAKFWKDLVDVSLKPISIRFQGQIKDMKESLRGLRNTILGALFLINIMWIVLLYTLQFPELEDYGLDSRAFQLLFLAVYGFIIIVQFITLICHRIVTLVHYLGRIRSDEINNAQNIVFELLSMETQL